MRAAPPCRRRAPSIRLGHRCALALRGWDWRVCCRPCTPSTATSRTCRGSAGWAWRWGGGGQGDGVTRPPLRQLAYQCCQEGRDGRGCDCQQEPPWLVFFFLPPWQLRLAPHLAGGVLVSWGVLALHHLRQAGAPSCSSLPTLPSSLTPPRPSYSSAVVQHHTQ